ncbi:MAG TPA: adenylate/guanylate cyclase domain-containing protein [Methylomirabilota bacterium]|nr:adenylate/guanylate cyclase domain-containing protein [Methylomirabilota bacterium]
MTGLTLALAVAALAAVLAAITRRWFARFTHGFLIGLMLALAGAGLAIAGVLGVWAHGESRDALVGQIVSELTHIAGIQQNEITEDLHEAHTQLQFFVTRLTDEARRHPAAVRERLRELQAFDPRYLQVNLMDVEGRVLVSSSLGEPEPANRVGVAHTLEGKPFTSDVYFSPAFRRWVIYLSAPARDAGGAVTGAVSARYDMQADLKRFVNAVRFGATGFTAVVNGDGRVIAHPDDARLDEDASRWPVVRDALQGRTVSAVAAAGAETLMVGRPFEGPATVNPRPWVLVAEAATAEVLAPVRALRLKFALAALVAGAACLVVAGLLARSVTRPLHDLVGVVHKIRGGDLTAGTPLAGRDEIGHLGTALNEMAHALRDRERIKEIFGRYVTTQVSQELLDKQITLGGERRRVTMLFSDIRNFTTMSEAMTPEQIIDFLNDYFSEMVDAVFEHHGVLDKFIGDGMLAVFGSLDVVEGHERRAVLTALRMKARLAKLNGERAIVGLAPIAIGVGIHTDEVIVGNIGSRKRLEYTVIGDGVNTCSRVEGLNKEFGTTILITDATWEPVRGEFECRPMPEASLKGKTKTPRVFEVVSARRPGA